MLRIFIFFVVLAGCQHAPSSSQLAEAGNCDAAYNQIPWETSQIKFQENSKQVAGTAASYTATGLGYLTDAFVIVGEGAVQTIVYCPYTAVAVAASVAMKANMPHLVYCGMGQITANSPRLGQKIYYGTSNFRKADFDKISKLNRNAATCYAKKGGPENKRVAAEKLEPLAKDESFLANLSAEEREKLTADYRIYKE
jgi:hypothetical protein